jgi:putative protease
LLIIGPTTGFCEVEATEIRVKLKSVDSAHKGEDCSIPSSELVRRGDKVYKWIITEEEFII